MDLEFQATGESEWDGDRTGLNYTLDKYGSHLSREGDFIYASLLIFVGCLSLTGNGFLALIFLRRRRKLSSVELLLCILCLQNLSITSMSIFSIVSALSHRWSFGHLGCSVSGGFGFFMGMSYVQIVLGIAILRYRQICLNVKQGRTPARVCKTLCCVYIVPSSISLMTSTGFLGEYGVEPFGLACSIRIVGSGIESRILVILFFISSFILPGIVTAYCYTRILRTVTKSKAALDGQSAISDTGLTRVSHIIIWIGVTYGLCFGPRGICSAYAAIMDNLLLPAEAVAAIFLLAYLAAIVTPMTYVLLSETYRNELKVVMRNTE